MNHYHNTESSITIEPGVVGGEPKRILITRNSSLTRTQIKLIIGFFAIVLGTIATVFYIQGVWMVLPFAGLELLAVSAGFYTCLRHKHDFELIKVGNNQVEVKRQVANRKQSYCFQIYWTKICLEMTKGWYPSRLWVRSKGRHVELGQWLTDTERQQLATRLKNLIEY